MNIRPFALERYFARHEFSARYLLSCSDCEALSMQYLLDMASEKEMAVWKNLRLGYTESKGHPLLLQAVADMYSGVDPEHIITAAPEECVFLCMHALLEAGDHIVCTFPGYQSLYELARSMGCQVSMWEADEKGEWCFDVRKLEGLVRDNTKLIVVNFPHNPTGGLPGATEYDTIIDIARNADAHLFSDEMYRHLEVADDTTLPSACECYDKAVSLSGLSKAFGLPGLRTGWLVSRDPGLIEAIGVLKDYTTICSSAPSEILAIIAMRRRAHIIGIHRQRILKNLAVLDEFFEKHQSLFHWIRPKGGSIGLARTRFTDQAAVFCDRLVRETGIMLVPSEMFDYGGCHVRIGFGRKNLPEVLERFGAYLQKHV